MPVIRTPTHQPRGCCEPNANVQDQLTTVRSTLISPDGRPLAGREVVAVLRAAPTWLEDRTGRVADTARTRTDRDGQWSLRLLPNKYLEPPTNEGGDPTPTSYYEISEGGLISTALVPGAGEHVDCPERDRPCSVWLRDILINGPQPGPVPWAPINTLGKLHNVTPAADEASKGQALIYNGHAWAPQTPTGDGPGAHRLDEMEDVDAPDPGQGQVLVFNGRVWTPGQPITDLESLRDVDAANPAAGCALLYNGRMWTPGPVATTLDTLQDVSAPDPGQGQVLTYQDQSWTPATPREELALLSDMHPSIAAAEPGDTLTAIERDPTTGRLLWGVDRDIPHLEITFGGRAGGMQVHAEVTSPESVTTIDIEIQWEGTPEGPTTTLAAGLDYTAAHTYTTPGTRTIHYRYTDDSDSGSATITTPVEETHRA